MPLPKRPFECCRVLSAKANASQLVRSQNNFYSVPQTWAGRALVLKAYVDRVDIYANHLLIASPPRLYGEKRESFVLDHYLDTLLLKPGALEYARPYKGANLPPVYNKYLAALKEHHARAQKEFVKILLLHRQCGWDVLDLCPGGGLPPGCLSRRRSQAHCEAPERKIPGHPLLDHTHQNQPAGADQIQPAFRRGAPLNASTDLLLQNYLKRLKLPTVARNYRALAREAAEKNCPYEEYLCSLLEQEVLTREEHMRQVRIRRANFPVLKTLEGFDFTAIPSLNKQKVLSLSQGEYIKQKENVILIGNSGTGKTHLAIALALCACRQGYRARFYTAPGLVTELLAASREYRLPHFEKQWLKQDLIVVDELGYVPYTPEGAQMFFRVIAGRYERGSVIITSNLEFPEWTQVLGEEKLTAALLDRLTHRCHILVMNGESYRFRESLKRREEDLAG